MSDKRPGLAARAGRWSANHRAIAIFGWIFFVVAAAVIGGNVGTKKIKDGDGGTGSSKTADQAIERSFPKQPASEIILIQARKGSNTSPEFKAVAKDVRARLADDERHPEDRAGQAVEGRPLGHRRLRAEGRPGQVRGHRRRRFGHDRRPAARASRVPRRGVRRRERGQGAVEALQGRLPEVRGDLDPADPDHPAGRVRRTARRARAGAAGRLRRCRDARPDGARLPAHPGRRRRRQRRAARRPGGRRRLHDVLPPPRARGARERRRPPRGDRDRGHDVRARDTRLRPDGDDRDGRHVPDRRSRRSPRSRSARSWSSRSR